MYLFTAKFNDGTVVKFKATNKKNAENFASIIEPNKKLIEITHKNI
jgi:hypothetical protein